MVHYLSIQLEPAANSAAAIRTPRNADFIEKGVFAKVLDRNPTGRPGTAEELANGIMFLLSPAASYINGHTLSIDGGLSVAE